MAESMPIVGLGICIYFNEISYIVLNKTIIFDQGISTLAPPLQIPDVLTDQFPSSSASSGHCRVAYYNRLYKARTV